MNVQPPTAFVEGKVGLKRILPTRAEGDADYEPTVSNSLYDFNLCTFYEYDFTVGTEHDDCNRSKYLISFNNITVPIIILLLCFTLLQKIRTDPKLFSVNSQVS
jgi:hypothetical protein